MAKVKDFQKKVVDDADFKEIINGDYVCEFLKLKLRLGVEFSDMKLTAIPALRTSIL